MLAAWYDVQGEAADVLGVGELDDPHPAPGEVRVRMTLSQPRRATGVGLQRPVVPPVRHRCPVDRRAHRLRRRPARLRP
jgi:hypothetical protein